MALHKLLAQHLQVKAAKVLLDVDRVFLGDGHQLQVGFRVVVAPIIRRLERNKLLFML
jgi:hypothetical protein